MLLESRGASDLAVSSSCMPFLKDLMPVAKSPISSEILPRPPNSSRNSTTTTIQCQILNEPIGLSSAPTRPHHRPLGPFCRLARFAGLLSAGTVRDKPTTGCRTRLQLHLERRP